MKLRLSEEAQKQIEEIDAWRRESRLAAPLLFRQELREAILQIEASPESGTPYLRAGKPYRWVLLPKTRYLLYYSRRAAQCNSSCVSCVRMGYPVPGRP